MARPITLTPEQMSIIDNNLELFPAQIQKLPGMEDKKITRGMIKYYQKQQIERELPNNKEMLLAQLKSYMDTHGLPSRFHGRNNVTGFIEFLKE